MSTQTPRVTIPRTEAHILASGFVDHEYQVMIGLPENYADSTDSYPVLYLLDGNCYFGTTVETVRMGAVHRELPEMIVVGIGYPVDTIMATALVRLRDYIPTRAPGYEEDFGKMPGAPEHVESGHAAAFLQFVREELTPWLDARYRANATDRTILGHSAGGTFGLYALFQQPDFFQRYVVASPATGWDEQFFLKQEEDFAQSHADLAATVFVSIGSLEESEADPDSNNRNRLRMKALVSALRSRDYASLKLTTHVFEGETHISVIPASISRGLQAVFR